MKESTRCSVAMGESPAHCRNVSHALVFALVFFRLRTATHPLREPLRRAQRKPLRDPPRRLAVRSLRRQRALLLLTPHLFRGIILRSHGAAALLSNLDGRAQTQADNTGASKADGFLQRASGGGSSSEVEPQHAKPGGEWV